MQQQEHIEQDQIDRRERSEAIMKAHEVPVNPDRGYLPGAATAVLRTPDELADRALALCYMVLKGEGLEPDFLEVFERKYRVSAKFSPDEKEFFKSKKPTEEDLLDARWRYEDLAVLVWALGLIDELPYPETFCDGQAVISAILSHEDEVAFKSAAHPRNVKELLDEADLTYRLFGACEDADAANQPEPGNLDSGVTYERHYTFSWILRKDDAPWDEVPTDL